MNTNTSISAANKLLEYVKGIQIDSKHKTLYRKSQTHLAELLNTCTDIIDTISDILEDCAFNSDGVDIKKDVDIMASRINRLQEFVSPSPHQELTSIYLADSELQDPMYFNCFNLLKDWYTCRFITSLKVNPSYTYKSDWITQWTENIVIGFGKHSHNGTLTQYYDSFNLWKSKVLDAKSPSRYSVPYEVYNYDIGLTEDDCTIEALILWDELSRHNLSGVITAPLSMYNRFARVSDIVDEYDRLGGRV